MKITRKFLVAFILCAFVLGLVIIPGSVAGQGSSSVYVPETGHWIWGEFLSMYNSVNDPLLYFGYPITDDFVDPVTNEHVQYFQKARFDLVDTSSGPRVILAPLGRLLHEDGAQLADIAEDGPTCRRFDTGYSVCYAFLQFYDANSGQTYFGQPVSALEVIDGRYVQYFEYARMEWWPERTTGERVLLTGLGKVYFDKVVANPTLLKSTASSNIAGQLINPYVRVFAQDSLIGVGENQTVYIVVQDQFLKAVPQAQVGVTITLPDGTSQFYRLAETNEYGVSQFSFTVPELAVQSVIGLRAEVTVRGETATGSGWFRIWW
jgi:hypothetical protein